MMHVDALQPYPHDGTPHAEQSDLPEPGLVLSKREHITPFVAERNFPPTNSSILAFKYRWLKPWSAAGVGAMRAQDQAAQPENINDLWTALQRAGFSFQALLVSLNRVHNHRELEGPPPEARRDLDGTEPLPTYQDDESPSEQGPQQSPLA